MNKASLFVFTFLNLGILASSHGSVHVSINGNSNLPVITKVNAVILKNFDNIRAYRYFSVSSWGDFCITTIEKERDNSLQNDLRAIDPRQVLVVESVENCD